MSRGRRANCASAIEYLGMTTSGVAGTVVGLRTRPGANEQQAPLHQCLHRNRNQPRSHALLFTLHKVENKFGRDRANETRWGPRTLDLDLIAYDDVSIEKPELTLPHPRLFERAFVLVPLAEIVPDRVIAGHSVTAALARLSTEGILRLPGLG